MPSSQPARLSADQPVSPGDGGASISARRLRDPLDPRERKAAPSAAGGEPAEARVAIHWCKSWAGRPILSPDKCPHSGPDALTINQRLEPTKRGRHVIAFDASICMACGTDSTGKLDLADGLRACMDQHGWNREVGLRLYDLAEFHEDKLMRAAAIPIWCLYAFGWTGRQVVEALNSGEIAPSSQVPLGRNH